MKRRCLVLSFEEAEEILSRRPEFCGDKVGLWSVDKMARILNATIGASLKENGISRIEVEAPVLFPADQPQEVEQVADLDFTQAAIDAIR